MADGFEQLIALILDGAADGQEDRVYEALRQRQRVVSAKLASTLRKGDKVRFKQTASPVYIRGLTGTVSGFQGVKVMVKFDEGQSTGRYRDEVKAPMSIIELDPTAPKAEEPETPKRATAKRATAKRATEKRASTKRTTAKRSTRKRGS